MSRGFSIYLDLLRFLAALVVFISHFAYQRFSGGDFLWVRDLNLGSDGVIIFFVLSGFVIAQTTQNKSAKDYSIARAARLYSVVIPAILLTIILDRFGSILDQAAYSAWWHNSEAPFEQFVRAITLSNYAFGDTIRFGTNGPFWSVVFEAWYYLAFGIAVFCQGWKRILLLVLLVLFAGAPILLLLPCWLIGVFLQRRLKNYKQPVPFKNACVAIIMPWLMYGMFLWADVPGLLTGLTFLAFGAEQTPNQMFGFADEFLWNYILAALVAVHLAGVFALAGQARRISAKNEARIRWLAGGTFSLYLFHYPIMSFLHVLPGYDAQNMLHFSLLAVATVFICYALAELSERRLKQWKSMLSSVFSLQFVFKNRKIS